MKKILPVTLLALNGNALLGNANTQKKLTAGINYITDSMKNIVNISKQTDCSKGKEHACYALEPACFRKNTAACKAIPVKAIKHMQVSIFCKKAKREKTR